ncbi:hypothetical protein FNV43_RR03265 [Rhamnella rubrinervis]|uniref:(R)-mandelonitrile lyase n=1 Tax=Rhamnella rubrinervis TaxID=2594499 RepID=A0A8K0HHN8_9ROSA|nr:hypothetical protein FNV43_RR03265 [Rhamnella rubrinervis]
MNSVYNATDLPLKEEYDYIVVGGGTAGCPLAATLSKRYSVLVLERGSAPTTYPDHVLIANGLFTSLLAEDDGKTPAQRFVSEDGVDNVRGRVLGGSSMINGGFYSRANHKFYKESGVDWDMKLVDKAYRWVENTVVYVSNLSNWQANFKEAFLEAGVGPDNGFNLNHVVGTKISASSFDDQGRRHGSVELLNRGKLNNLKVAVEAYVQKIIFSSKASRLSASGVIYNDSKGKIHKAFVRDKGEVILSAGAIGSPQLLLLSGVGPASYLSSLKIPVVHQNSYVGKYLADNPRNNINLVFPFILEPSSLQVVAITNESNYIESISYDLQFSFPKPFALYSKSTSPINFSIATIVEKFLGPLSKGSLKLVSSKDVRISPKVRFNYFANPEDLTRCVRGMRKVGDILKTKPMDKFKFHDWEGDKDFRYLGPSLPKNYKSDNASMEKFCRSTVTTFWHYHGGCVVGKVVDGKFRVIGINSLRVVDGSIFNSSPGTNPQGSLMMMGRYVGLRILQERRAGMK